VWVVVGALPRQLVKVDARTLKVLHRYDIPGSVTAVRAGLGGVWIADVAKKAILRFDPVTEAVVATIEVGWQPQFLAVGEGAVWVMNQLDGTVSRIDPASNTVVATIAVGEPIEGGDIAVGGGYVWLRGSDTLLFKIDPATNAIVARYGPSSGSGSVAADDNAVWVTAHDITTVWRLPLR
jgi:YVTN family beta-propeller protein